MSDTVEFRSKSARYRLTRRGEIQQFLPTGIRTTVQKPVEYLFEPVADGAGGEEGKLVVKRGTHVLQDGIDWLRPGEDDAIERDAVDALMAMVDYGSDFWVKGFSPAETARLPRPVDFRKDVVRAATALDEDAVATLLQQELDTHGRGDLVTFAQDALDALRETKAALEAEQPVPADPKPAAKGGK